MITLAPTATIDDLWYVPGPRYGCTTAASETSPPCGGAGIMNCFGWPLAAGVPAVAICAHELFGLVTPGNARNDACKLCAPDTSRCPLKAIRPAMTTFLVVVARVWTGVGFALKDADVPGAGVVTPEDPAADGPE
jgi:hypothetical protein